MVTTRLQPLARPRSLREQVYDAIEELIIDRTLPPGARLNESELAKLLQVSRNPVREALPLLARSGWVDLEPRVGAQVHEPTVKEVDDFFLVRTALKSESAREACRKATSVDISDLHDLVSRGVAAVDQGNQEATSEMNSQFHDRVNAIADNHVLLEILALMKKRLRWYFVPVARVRGYASWEEHIRLVAAFECGDEDAAEAAMREHSVATEQTYRSHFTTRASAGD